MVEWKVGDRIVSKVTSYATVYTVVGVERSDGNQVVEITIEDRPLHGWFSSSLFELYVGGLEDTRPYLDAITSCVERNENEEVS